MKLVATSDFRNPNPEKIEVEDRLHDMHVHKGARFSIGGELPLEKLSAADKKLVAELNTAGRIVEESQTDKVKMIDSEVAQEERRAEKEKEKAAAKKEK